MKNVLVLVFFICFFAKTTLLRAQCVDSSLIQYGYCDPDWVPVCACDEKTYRNDCFARNNGMVNWYYGICDAVDFDFNPNPPTDYINVDAIMKYAGNMNVQLLDRFGRIFYNNSFDYVSEFQFQIYVKGFPTGLYFLNIWCNEGYKVRKVVVTDFR